MLQVQPWSLPRPQQSCANSVTLGLEPWVIRHQRLPRFLFTPTSAKFTRHLSPSHTPRSSSHSLWKWPNLKVPTWKQCNVLYQIFGAVHCFFTCRRSTWQRENSRRTGPPSSLPRRSARPFSKMSSSNDSNVNKRRRMTNHNLPSSALGRTIMLKAGLFSSLTPFYIIIIIQIYFNIFRQSSTYETGWSRLWGKKCQKFLIKCWYCLNAEQVSRNAHRHTKAEVLQSSRV